MKLDCRMNGQALGAVDERVQVLDVEEEPQVRLVSCADAGRGGLRFLRRERESLTVHIRLCVRERDVVRRTQVLDKIAAWCGDGILTANHRPGQRLHCVCVQCGGASALRWTEETEILFKAYGRPWWESETPAVVRLNAGQKKTLCTPGHGEEALAEAELRNAGEEMVNEAVIRCGDTWMRFEQLGLAKGERLVMRHDREGLLQLRVMGGNGERSAMDKRTAQSTDELLVVPGKGVTVTLEADGQAEGVIRTWGRYC